MDRYLPSKLVLPFLLLFLTTCGPTEQGEEVGVNPPAAPVPLDVSNWRLVQMTVAGGFVFTPDDPGKYVLNFRSENRLTGTSDCNRITGSWQQEDTALRFEPFSTTRSLCPPGSLHNNLVLHLRDVVAHEFRDGHMFLSTTIEGVELEFESLE